MREDRIGKNGAKVNLDCSPFCLPVLNNCLPGSLPLLGNKRTLLSNQKKNRLKNLSCSFVFCSVFFTFESTKSMEKRIRHQTCIAHQTSVVCMCVSVCVCMLFVK